MAYTRMKTKHSIKDIEYLCSRIDYQEYFDKHIIPHMSAYYYDGVDFAMKPKCRCPLHSEDTGSFSLFYSTQAIESYRRWKCFGCGETGNIIDLHVRFNKVQLERDITFDEAYAELKSEFLDGRTINIAPTASRIKLASDEGKKLNNFDDYQAYNDIKLRLNTALTYQQIDEDVKIEIYTLLDKLDILMEHDMANGTKVAEDLKKYLSERSINI